MPTKAVRETHSEKIIEKVVTQNGEITVNLNLNIKLDGSNLVIGIEEKPVNQKQESKIDFTEKVQDVVPEEMFDLEIPTIEFGKIK